MTNKEIGRIGLSMAINYFTIQGYVVSLPLNDTQWYDMIVEKDNIFYTVQCKATMTQESEIVLQSKGGTNGQVYDSILNHPNLDYIFCVNKDLDCWLIPFQAIKDSGNTKAIRLRKELSKYSNPKLDTTKYYVNYTNGR